MANFFPASSSNMGAGSSHASWVDEFFDYSSSGQRGAFARSLCDHVALFDLPAAASTAIHSGEPTANEIRVSNFEHLGVQQLMEVFSDGVHEEIASGEFVQPAAETQSVEEQRRCKFELPEASIVQQVSISESAVDPKRMKRILANRQSAQKSRVRKLQYITELEQSVMSLQEEVSALSPRVAFLDHQRSLLKVGNNALKQQIASLTRDKFFQDAHHEALKEEIERLRQVYTQQNFTKTPYPAGSPANSCRQIEKILS